MLSTRLLTITRFSALVLGTASLAACNFSFKAGTGANAANTPPPPPNAAQAPPAPAPAPTPTPAPRGPVLKPLGRQSHATPPATPTPATPAPTGAPAPSAPPVIASATPFGSGTVDATGFKGSIFFVPAGTTKIPQLASMQPSGFLFTKDINVAPQPFKTGFPGVDPARVENFAIRYEAPLVVTTEADYTFRIVADDGAILLIDNTPIVDDDGARSAPAEKTGPVHLVTGTHLVTVDYLQTSGSVALQLFCKKANDAEKICPTQL